MPSYRLYFLNALGQIQRAVQLSSQDDESAIVEAESHNDGVAMELWDQARVVRKFEPQSAQNA